MAIYISHTDTLLLQNCSSFWKTCWPALLPNVWPWWPSSSCWLWVTLELSNTYSFVQSRAVVALAKHWNHHQPQEAKMSLVPCPFHLNPSFSPPQLNLKFNQLPSPSWTSLLLHHHLHLQQKDVQSLLTSSLWASGATLGMTKNFCACGKGTGTPSVSPSYVNTNKVYIGFTGPNKDFLALQLNVSVGWYPQILAERDARKHPQFDKYKSRFEKFPTVNPQHYEIACYLRWLALSQVGGGKVLYNTSTIHDEADALGSLSFSSVRC